MVRILLVPVAAVLLPTAIAIGQQTGTISGTVINSSNASAVTGASVRVLGVDGAGGKTGPDGRFVIKDLPPGTYEVQMTAPLFRSARVTGVEVKAGKDTRIRSTMTPQVDTGIEVVEVVGNVNESSEASQLLKRKLAPTVSDNLGAESISKTPDSDAAEVVTRVPAVTIKDDKFIVVRGLNERYSGAVVNRSRMPSTDPNRRVVPLDLFPADFIESLSISKSYTPDLPGDFAGGLVDITLASPPQEWVASMSVTVGLNTETTFGKFSTYPGCTEDWFGFGGACRDLPSGTDVTLIQDMTPIQERLFVGALPLNWDLEDEKAPPNFGIDGGIGGAIGDFSFNFSAVYDTSHQRYRDEISGGFTNPQLFFRDELDCIGKDPNGNDICIGFYNYDRTEFETKLGGILTTEYRLSPSHKLSGRGLYNRKSNDEVFSGFGSDESDAIPKFSTAQIYTADQLGFGQLEGSHLFPWVEVDWRASWAPSSEEQPDTKYTVYAQANDDDPVYRLDGKSPSTLRTWLELDEFLQDYYLDFTIPFRTRLPFTDVWSGLQATLKAGVNYSLRERDMEFKRLGTQFTSTTLDLSLPPNTLLQPANYGGSPFSLENLTRVNDTFSASQEIGGVYAMVDTPIIAEKLRLIAGARLEYSYISTEGASQTEGESTAIINDLDVMPGISLVYSPVDTMNVRAAYSQTVSRPEFRELTPTTFPAAPGRRTLQGNQDLVSAAITSYDLRWEWFPNTLELASVSVFYKELKNPIELNVRNAASELRDQFLNAEEATVFGVELEGRKNFAFLVRPLRGWRWTRPIAGYFADLETQANFSWIESEVTLPDVDSEGVPIAVTSKSRALQGQAPFTVNLSIQYEHYRWGLYRFLYNTVGRTIDSAGIDQTPEDDNPGTPDIFSEQRHALDFVWLLDLDVFGIDDTNFKFAVENILDDDYRKQQGKFVVSQYKKGTTFSIGLRHNF